MTALSNLLENLSDNNSITHQTIHLLKSVIDNQLFDKNNSIDSILYKICKNEINILSVECIKMLIVNGASVNRLTPNCRTPLIELCRKKSNVYTNECVEILLNAGADVSITDVHCRSVLQIVCGNVLTNHSITCIRMLMDAGAQSIDGLDGPLINMCKCPNEYTIECLKYMLLNSTSEINYPECSTDWEDNNALMVLAKGEINRYVQDCFNFLNNRLDFNPSKTNKNGDDLLMLLCRNPVNQYTLECIKIFLNDYKYSYMQGFSQCYSNSLILLVNNITEYTLKAAYIIVDVAKECLEHQFNIRTDITKTSIKTIFFNNDSSHNDPSIVEKIQLFDKIVMRFCHKTLIQFVCENVEFTSNHYDILMMIILKSDVTTKCIGKTAYQYFLENPTSNGLLTESEMKLLQGVTKMNNIKSAK